MVLEGDHVVLQSSSAVGIRAREVRLVKSNALVVASGAATVEEGSRILVYLGSPAPSIRPTFDTVSVAVFGAAVGTVLVLLGGLVRRLVR
jgi:hypothetical protein